MLDILCNIRKKKAPAGLFCTSHGGFVVSAGLFGAVVCGHLPRALKHFRIHEPIRDVPLRDGLPSGDGVVRPAGAEAASFARRGAASERARVVSGVSRSLFIVGIRCIVENRA